MLLFSSTQFSEMHGTLSVNNFFNDDSLTYTKNNQQNVMNLFLRKAVW